MWSGATEGLASSPVSGGKTGPVQVWVPGVWIACVVRGAGSVSKRKGCRHSGPIASWSPGSVGPSGIRLQYIYFVTTINCSGTR